MPLGWRSPAISVSSPESLSAACKHIASHFRVPNSHQLLCRQSVPSLVKVRTSGMTQVGCGLGGTFAVCVLGLGFPERKNPHQKKLVIWKKSGALTVSACYMCTFKLKTDIHKFKSFCFFVLKLKETLKFTPPSSSSPAMYVDRFFPNPLRSGTFLECSLASMPYEMQHWVRSPPTCLLCCYASCSGFCLGFSLSLPRHPQIGSA